MPRTNNKIPDLVSKNKLTRFSQLWKYLDIVVIADHLKVKPEQLRTLAPLKLESLFTLADFVGITEREILDLVMTEHSKNYKKKVSKSEKKNLDY